MHCSQSRHCLYNYIVYTKYNHAYGIPYNYYCLSSSRYFRCIPSIRAEAPEGTHAALDADFRDAGENPCGTGANLIQSLGSPGAGCEMTVGNSDMFFLHD